MDWKIPVLLMAGILFAKFSRPIPMLGFGLVLLGLLFGLIWLRMRGQ